MSRLWFWTSSIEMRLALFYAVDLDDRELAGVKPEPVLRRLNPMGIKDIGINKPRVRP